MWLLLAGCGCCSRGLIFFFSAQNIYLFNLYLIRKHIKNRFLFAMSAWQVPGSSLRDKGRGTRATMKTCSQCLKENKNFIRQKKLQYFHYINLCFQDLHFSDFVLKSNNHSSMSALQTWERWESKWVCLPNCRAIPSSTLHAQWSGNEAGEKMGFRFKTRASRLRIDCVWPHTCRVIELNGAKSTSHRRDSNIILGFYSTLDGCSRREHPPV